MSEWHVSASESEGEDGSERKAETGVLELGGLKIPPARMVDLLQVASSNKRVCAMYFFNNVKYEISPI